MLSNRVSVSSFVISCVPGKIGGDRCRGGGREKGGGHSSGSGAARSGPGGAPGEDAVARAARRSLGGRGGEGGEDHGGRDTARLESLCTRRGVWRQLSREK